MERLESTCATHDRLIDDVRRALLTRGKLSTYMRDVRAELTMSQCTRDMCARRHLCVLAASLRVPPAKSLTDQHLSACGAAAMRWRA